MTRFFLISTLLFFCFAYQLSGQCTLALDIASRNVTCNGKNNGFAKALPTGASGTVSFVWKTCAGATVGTLDSITNLFSDCYIVVGTDANGCTAADTVQITQPPKYEFKSVQDSVNCKGGSDGTATILATGNTPPYTYQWDNGQTTPTAIGLNATFHTVIVTDANQCQEGTLVQVFEPAKFLIDSIRPQQVPCFGEKSGSARVFASGGTAPYRYDWGNGQTAAQAVMLAAGTYTVTVSDWHDCSATISTTITEPPLLTVAVANVAAERCANDCKGEATIQVGGGSTPYDYQWDNPAIPDGTTMPKNLCPGQYTVTVKDFRGCSQSATVVILSAAPLQFQFDKISPTCTGLQNGSIMTQVSGGTLPYQYAWSNGSNTRDLLNIPCGTYTLTLTDGAGCVRDNIVEVLCPTPVQVQSIVAQAVRCFGGSDGNIHAKPGGGAGPYTYQWNDLAMQVDSIAKNLSIGAYTITITDSKGCTATASAMVTQPAQLVVSIATTPATCFGGSDGTATATATGGTLNKIFVWNDGISGAQRTDLAIGTYAVTTTDQIGCTATATAEVTQPAGSILVTITQVRPACYHQSNGTVSATASGGNGGPFNYVWGNGQTGPSLTGLGNEILTLTVRDSKGCSVSQTLESKQLDTIIVNVGYVAPSCFGYADGNAAVNKIYGGAGMEDSVQYYNFRWSLPNVPNSIYLNNVPGGFYSVTATDSLGCNGSYTFEIKQPVKIEIQPAHTDVSCFGLTDGLAEVLSVTSDHPILKYEWSNGTFGQKNPGLAEGTYIVTLTDTMGCEESDTVRIEEPSPVNIDLDVVQLLCTSDSNARVTSSVQGGTPGYSYLWSTGATGPTLGGLGPGIYNLQVTDKNGCSLTDSVYVIRPDSLSLQVETIDPLCFGNATGRIKLFVQGGQQPYRYSLNEGDFKGSSVFIGLHAGAYTLHVRDARGCVTTINTSLSQPPRVQVSVGLDTTILLGDSILLQAEASNVFGAAMYAWRGALSDSIVCIDTSDCSSILVSPLFSNTYIVTATDEHGCKGEATIKVLVEKPRSIYVPTGFSPNGDGNNDFLPVYAKSGQIKRIVRFQVFDRWGELLFEDADFPLNDATRGWDGQFRGQPCRAGVYVWQAEVEYLDGYRDALSGGVTLVR